MFNQSLTLRVFILGIEGFWRMGEIHIVNLAPLYSAVFRRCRNSKTKVHCMALSYCIILKGLTGFSVTAKTLKYRLQW